MPRSRSVGDQVDRAAAADDDDDDALVEAPRSIGAPAARARSVRPASGGGGPRASGRLRPPSGLSAVPQAQLQPLIRALRSFVPAVVEQRVEAGQHGSLLAESRNIVTVFLRLLGLGERLCEVRSLTTLQKAVEEVQVTCNQHGGEVTRLICDDKGVRFLVGFGMPGRSFEDDERRAALSSLVLQRKLPRTCRVSAAIGITTGVAYCGESGSQRPAGTPSAPTSASPRG